MPMPRRLPVSALAFALAAIIVPARAAEPTTAELLARIASLEQRLAALEGNGTASAYIDQRLRAVERNQELQSEADATKAAPTPRRRPIAPTTAPAPCWRSPPCCTANHDAPFTPLPPLLRH